MADIELFVQRSGQRNVELVRVADDLTVADLIAVLRERGIEPEGDGELLLTVEDEDDSAGPSGAMASSGIRHRSRVHLHRCRRISVNINFNGASKQRHFSPAATLKRVRSWANNEFDIPPADATETVLQLCGTREQPDEDLHLGSVAGSNCEACFDLIVKLRVEG